MRAYLLIVCLLAVFVDGQSYIPRPVPLASCSTGQSIVSIGDDNVDNTDIHSSTTQTQSNFILTTTFNNTTPSTTISQLSFGILDNYQITNVALIRLGLYRVAGASMIRLGQTSEIMLYATGRTVIYADLIEPVTIQRGTYAVAVWSNQALYTGVNNVVEGMTANSIATTYTSTSLPLTFTPSAILGGRAVKMVGCSTGKDPWYGPTTAYYSFCFTGAYTTPALNYLMASSTVIVTLNGIVAVDTSTGSFNQGYIVTAGNAQYSTVTYGATTISFPAPVTQPARTIVAGGSITQTSQRFYPSSPGVDHYGLSFEAIDGTESQFIFQYQNNTHEIMLVTLGSSTTIQFDVGQFSASLVSNPDAPFPSCLITPSSYFADSITCPTGQVPVKYGADEEHNAVLTVDTPTSLLNANFLVMRAFTANIPGTTLYQLSWLVNANMPLNRVARIRLGLFTNNVGTYTLVRQTQEIKLWGTTARTLLKASLLQPVTLIQDRNYSIGVIADSPIYTSYASYMRAPAVISSTFGQLASSTTGFLSSILVASTVNTVLPVAASGCTTQATSKFSFCAAFVYPSYSAVYSGVLTTVDMQHEERGSFRPALDGTGTASYTYRNSSVAPRNFAMSLRDYNLDGDNRVYVQGNHNSPVNEYGLQFVVQQGSAQGLAIQLHSVYDAFSESWVTKENSMSYSSSVVSFLNPILSTLTIAPYSDGQTMPACSVPPIPANIVHPPPVARASCPNLVNDMADTFGDVDVGNYAHHVDGTTISGDTVYTKRFVADSAAVITQLAVGILQNTDRPVAIQVRLGLYSEADMSLIAQTSELTINQAVPQLINMNLPSPVSVQQGQSYLIAIITSAPLEVAHTALSDSLSMRVPFTSYGLPTTFTSSGNAVSPSIAAYACVQATHTFCASFQYYTPTRETVAYFYQGLIQTGPTFLTNVYGTYLPIWAAAGRLVSYRRGPLSIAQATTLYQFYQRPGTAAALYTNPVNGKALDAEGIIVQTNIGVDSNLQFNMSINKFDESFSFGSTHLESDLFHSNFSFSPLGPQFGIPSCGLSALPQMPQDRPPQPICEDGQEVITYGTGDQFSSSLNNQGVNIMAPNQIFLRQITTDGARWSILSQLKFGMNSNPNTISTIRLGIYDSRMRFIAGTDDVTFYNPNDYIATGLLAEPVYLAPATVYYLAVWTSAWIYAGFTIGSAGPSMAIPLDTGIWPDQFVDNTPNSMRAIGGFGCTISGPPTPDRPSLSSSATPVPFTSSSSGGYMPSPDSSSSTKSGLESGAIAGVVIGCVIGSNLILILCVWAFMLSGAAGKGTQHNILEESRVGGQPNRQDIELGTAV